MFSTELNQAVMDFTTLVLPISEKDLEREAPLDWTSERSGCVMSQTFTADGLSTFLSNQRRQIAAAFSEIEEVQREYQGAYTRFKADHDKTLRALTEKIESQANGTGNALMPLIEARLPQEQQSITQQIADLAAEDTWQKTYDATLNFLSYRPRSEDEVRRYLLEEAGFAMVPFQAFGLAGENGWFRLSVGAVSVRDVEEAMPRIETALRKY